MDLYEVILTAGYSVFIKADDFTVKFTEKVVLFSVGDKNIAIFNLDNILGFRAIEEDK